MQSINTILNWISNSLMLPVVVLLLVGMIYSLLMLGGFCAIYLRLLQERGKLQKIMNGICGVDGLILDNLGNGSFARKVRELDALGWDDLRCEKQITDYESKFAQELERAKLQNGTDVGINGNADSNGSGTCRAFHRRHCLDGLQYADSVCHDGRRVSYSYDWHDGLRGEASLVRG